jgi:hypothetical protein
MKVHPRDRGCSTAGNKSAANINEVTKTKDAQILAMIAQIKTLMDAVAALTKTF